MAEFIIIFTGSIVIGAIAALFISWVLKRQSQSSVNKNAHNNGEQEFLEQRIH